MIRNIAVLCMVIPLVIVAFVFIKGSIANSKPPAYINELLPQENQITFPTDKDTLTKGQIYTLRWNGGGSSPINIFLVNQAFEAEGVSVSLADRVYDIQNTGSYQYSVPMEIPTGKYKFEIGNLTSSYFEIVDP